MKFYFSGAIRGGRENRNVYFELIERLRGYGTVLTEFIGDTALTEAGSARHESETFQMDSELLRESDAVIAEVSTPSLGVGYEIGLAESLGIPVLCLYRSDDTKKLSAMIRGNPSLTIADYTLLDEAEEAIAKWVEESLPAKLRQRLANTP